MPKVKLLTSFWSVCNNNAQISLLTYQISGYPNPSAILQLQTSSSTARIPILSCRDEHVVSEIEFHLLGRKEEIIYPIRQRIDLTPSPQVFNLLRGEK